MFDKTPTALERAAHIYAPLSKNETWTVPLPGSERDGRSAVYRHRLFTGALLKTLDRKIETVHDFFEQTAASLPRNRCLGHRPWNPESRSFDGYVWQDYQTVAQRRANIGAGIAHVHRDLGLADSGLPVGLWCQNRPEWQLVDLGCMSQSFFTVSIYDTLGPTAAEYIIQHAEIACVAASIGRVPTLISLKEAGKLPNFRAAICIDSFDEGEQPGTSKLELLRSFAEKAGVSLYTLEEVERRGEANPVPIRPPKPTDLITINYTSGTTGNPKGVVLNHAAAVAATSASLSSAPQYKDDVFLSFLPLAHIFGRICEHAAMWVGGGIAYFHGNVVELVDDLKMVRPTVFAGVPRLYNRFGSAIRSATVEAPGFRGRLSNYVVSTKTAAINRPEDGSEGERTNKSAIWDRLWGRKVAAAIGLERCRVMVSGSAPIDRQLHQFLRVVFGNSIIQGYGLTETYACSIIQMADDLSAGTCGTLAPTTEAILVDVPDMGYTSKDKPNPRGELCLRSTSLMVEYYKSPEETAKAIDADGWFHTGDIAEIDSRGRFKIVDRVKNVLKLSQGEYVSPEKIENTFLANLSWLMSLYIHGDSTESCLVGVIGVDPIPFATWWEGMGGEKVKFLSSPGEGAPQVDREELGKLIDRPDVRQKVVDALEKVSRKTKMNRFEHCRSVRLFVDPFTIENGLLTPTLKMKRPQTGTHFRAAIDEMYGDLSRMDKAKL